MYNEITENEQMFGGGKIMTFSMIIRTIFEFALIAFTLWAVFHEDFFAALEQRIFASIRRSRLKILKANHSDNCKRFVSEL